VAAHRLAGFGGQVEVLSPASVRTDLIVTARELLARYRGEPGDARSRHPAADEQEDYPERVRGFAE